jgi:hypothetical protein
LLVDSLDMEFENSSWAPTTKKVLECVGTEHESSHQSRNEVQLATSFVLRLEIPQATVLCIQFQLHKWIVGLYMLVMMA